MNIKAFYKYFKKKDLINWGSCVGRKPYFYILDSVTAADIDYQYNFDFCEFMFLNKKKYKLKL